MLGSFMWITTEEELNQCFEVRKKVFMDECGYQEEFDEMDSSSYHLLFLDDETPIGTARLFFYENAWHIGRICVLPEYRKQGIATFLIKEALYKAQELKKNSPVFLAVPVSLQTFCEKLGFSVTGQTWQDEKQQYITMRYTKE